MILEFLAFLSIIGSCIVTWLVIDFFYWGAKYFKLAHYQLNHKTACDMCFKEIKNITPHLSEDK